MNIKHLQGPYKHVFMTHEEILAELKLMEKDSTLDTRPGYGKGSLSSARPASFRQIHMTYLKEHPKVNPEHYLSNLRTVLRIRP